MNRPQYQNKEWLSERYLITGSIYKMADEAGCSPRTIHYWMKKHGIVMHSMSGMKRSEESIAKSVKGRIGKPGPMKGKKHSPETRQKMSEGRKGSQNGNWKGGITQKVRKFRRTKEYMAWVKAVLERAGGRCEECGSTENVEAHHKVSLYLDFSKALDLNNGKALCQKCHKKRDWRCTE